MWFPFYQYFSLSDEGLNSRLYDLSNPALRECRLKTWHEMKNCSRCFGRTSFRMCARPLPPRDNNVRRSSVVLGKCGFRSVAICRSLTSSPSYRNQQYDPKTMIRRQNQRWTPTQSLYAPIPDYIYRLNNHSRPIPSKLPPNLSRF